MLQLSTKHEKILLELLFMHSNGEYEINLNEYIDSIAELKQFTETIINILLESNIEIVEQTYILSELKMIWTIKLKYE